MADPKLTITTEIDTTSIGLTDLIAALRGTARAIDPATARVTVTSYTARDQREQATSQIKISGQPAFRPGGVLRGPDEEA